LETPYLKKVGLIREGLVMDFPSPKLIYEMRNDKQNSSE
jgi:hypothetical protein